MTGDRYLKTEKMFTIRGLLNCLGKDIKMYFLVLKIAYILEYFIKADATFPIT